MSSVAPFGIGACPSELIELVLKSSFLLGSCSSLLCNVSSCSFCGIGPSVEVSSCSGVASTAVAGNICCDVSCCFSFSLWLVFEVSGLESDASTDCFLWSLVSSSFRLLNSAGLLPSRNGSEGGAIFSEPCSSDFSTEIVLSGIVSDGSLALCMEIALLLSLCDGPVVISRVSS